MNFDDLAFAPVSFTPAENGGTVVLHYVPKAAEDWDQSQPGAGALTLDMRRENDALVFRHEGIVITHAGVVSAATDAVQGVA